MNEEKTVHIAPPKRIEIAVAVALSLLALFLLVETISAAQGIGRSGEPATNVITVNGTGKATAKPDTARITFSVVKDATTAAAAQDAATKQGNEAINYVKGQGIEEKDVKTTSYNISPQYDYNHPCPPGAMCPDIYPGGTSKIVGYEVSQTVEVTVRDLDKVSALLTGLGQLNVQNVYGPDFTLDDPLAAQNAARAEAIADAKAQAETLADQLDVDLVRIVSFSENGGGYPYPMYAKGGVAMDMAVTNVAPEVPAGENEYTSNVSITYEIR